MLFKSQSPRILITGLAGLGVEVAAVGRRGRYAVPEHIEPRCSQALLNYLIFLFFFLAKFTARQKGSILNLSRCLVNMSTERGKSVSGSPAQQLAGGGRRLQLQHGTGGGGGHRGGCPTPPLPPWGKDKAGVGLCLRSSSRPTGPRLQVGQGRSRAVCSSPFPRLSCGQPGGSAGSVGAPSGQEDGSAPLSATSARWKSVLLREAISESSSKQKAAAQGRGEGGGGNNGGVVPPVELSSSSPAFPTSPRGWRHNSTVERDLEGR